LTFGAQSAYVLPSYRLLASGMPSFLLLTDGVRRMPSDGRYVWLPIDLEGDRFTITWHSESDLPYFH
jgi:hypothetical protein